VKKKKKEPSTAQNLCPTLTRSQSPFLGHIPSSLALHYTPIKITVKDPLHPHCCPTISLGQGGTDGIKINYRSTENLSSLNPC
jgi:hypothetical protein